MATAAVLLASAPLTIVSLYVRIDDPVNEALVHTAVALILVAAAFQVFDGTQSVAAGILRGYQDTTIPMLLAGIGYWGLGIVGGCILAFPLRYGALGMWWGLALGLAGTAALLALRLCYVARRQSKTATGGITSVHVA